MRGNINEGAELCFWANRTRGNILSLHQRKLRLNIRKHFFTERLVKHWHRLPRAVVESPYPRVFQNVWMWVALEDMV